MIDFHGLGISFIRQSLETPAPPTPGMAGTFTKYDLSVKASEVPRHWGKNTESPPLGTQLYINKVPCVESAVTAFLNPLTRH